jgi:hypothetical protein
MALSGNCTNTTYSNHESETTTETITNSDGTTQTIEVPVQVATTKSYEDVYLCIKQVEFFHYYNGEEKVENVIYQYAAYADVETRNANQEDFLFWNNTQLQNHNHSVNLYESIYNEIKTFEGLTNLIDA